MSIQHLNQLENYSKTNKQICFTVHYILWNVSLPYGNHPFILTSSSVQVPRFSLVVKMMYHIEIIFLVNMENK